MLMSSLAMSLSFISNSECKAEKTCCQTGMIERVQPSICVILELAADGGRMEQNPLGPGARGRKSQL